MRASGDVTALFDQLRTAMRVRPGGEDDETRRPLPVSGMLAALSGALLAPMVNPSPDVGAFPAIKSYVIVVLGGMGSIWGAMLASAGVSMSSLKPLSLV